MKLISIGQLDKNFLYPIVGGIFKFIIKLLLKIENLTILSNHSLILSIVSSLGMSLSFILLIFYKKPKIDDIPKNEDGNGQKEHNNKHIIELEYIDQYEEIQYDKFKYILFTSIIDIIITISM